MNSAVASSKACKGDAWFGYCASKMKHYYGFQGHLFIDVRGKPVALQLTPANADERDFAYELPGKISSMLRGDKGYIRPEFKKDCKALGIDLQTPVRRNMKDERPKKFVKLIMRIRRRIETVIGLLEKCFAIESCGCRDMWYLTSRMVTI